MQKRMRNSRPRTPGGRYADGSSSNPSLPGNFSKFTPPRPAKTKLVNPPKSEPEGGEAPKSDPA